MPRGLLRKSNHAFTPYNQVRWVLSRARPDRPQGWESHLLRAFKQIFGDTGISAKTGQKLRASLGKGVAGNSFEGVIENGRGRKWPGLCRARLWGETGPSSHAALSTLRSFRYPLGQCFSPPWDLAGTQLPKSHAKHSLLGPTCLGGEFRPLSPTSAQSSVGNRSLKETWGGKGSLPPGTK